MNSYIYSGEVFSCEGAEQIKKKNDDRVKIFE